MKELLCLSFPPDFSELSIISLKSHVRNQGRSRDYEIDERLSHTACLFGISGVS